MGKKNKLQSRIVTPNSEGYLIEGQSNSLAFIKPLGKSFQKEMLEAEFKQLVTDRNQERFARKRGQSGFKMNVGCSFWLKDTKNNMRVLCQETKEKETVNINGRQQSVPTFEAICIKFK